MSLPRSVQQQADVAKQHFESLQNPEPTAPEVDEKTPDAPDTATQSAEPEAKPDDEKRSQGEDKTPTDEPKRSEAYWEHRFNVINGKYAAEVPALREEVRTLTKKLEDADRQITELQSASDQPTNPDGLTDEQMAKFKEEFGEDFVSFVQRMVSSSASKPDNSAEVDELKRKVETFEQKEQERTSASFWTALGELVPDWKTVNDDKKFHDFLSQYDPQTGQQRQQSLSTAQQALDADGVAAVFNAFKKQQPKPETQRIPDDQVDPPTSRSTTTPEAGKIWTGAEIKDFYTKKAAGKYSAEEGKRLEADIFAAQREGRVR
ncbi:hypothetical protein O4H29_06840 [Marinobacter salarius]|jgi:uncharacterized protein YeaO (DUF488 family)|uniref:hypothetical protein n=1 Tax=Marinobacter salarius TaxID=1420917 RepID=UPI0022B1EE15|nr:hypothetical protein [Marinobacter salarius]MCZ4284549.1 hypothetical protein [Marinobacter salarius]